MKENGVHQLVLERVSRSYYQLQYHQTAQQLYNTISKFTNEFEYLFPDSGTVNPQTTLAPNVNGENSKKEDDGVSTAQTAGIAIGILLALIIIIIIVVIVLKNRKSKNSNSNQQQKYANGKTNNGYEMDRRP